MRKGVGIAHGKMILMGEHSVVYGKLSVGIPFMAVTLKVEISEIETDSTINCQLYRGKLRNIPYYLENILSTYQKIRQDLNLSQQNFKIDIESNIPVERGLGSSAAVAVALVRAFEDYAGIKLSLDKFLAYVDLSEKICHGNPSGLDARLISLEQPLLYQKNQKMDSFYFYTPFYLLVVDTGITGQTKLAVEAVRENYESAYYSRSKATQYAIDALDDLANAFHNTLENDPNNLAELSRIIDQAHENLRTLQVSSPEQDYGIAFAKKHGALAGKITGGGRGGCFYLLMESLPQAEELKDLLLKERIGVDAWIVPFSAKI